MAISEMKKLTLLAEKEYLEAVILSLQSEQAVEIIPTTSDIQRKLVNEYYETLDEEVKDGEASSDDQVFELISKENEINRLTNTLERLDEDIEFLEEVLPSPSFFAQFTQEKETYSLYQLEDYMKDKDVPSLLDEAEAFRNRVNELRTHQESLEEERAFLNRWRSLDFNPKETEHFQLTETIVGAIHSERNDELQAALNDFNEVYLEEISYSEEQTAYLVLVSLEEAADVKKTLVRHRFERLDYTYDQLPAEELKRNKKDLEEITQKMNQLNEQPEEYTQLLTKLKMAEEYIFNVRERLRVVEEVFASEHLFILSGWIEENMIDEQIQTIENNIGQENIFVLIDDVKESEEDEVPTKYENNEVTGAFESVVSMYSTPKYNEIDPTKFVQPFSILFFGMMTADAGYGLIGVIATLLALKFLNLSDGLKKNVEFFSQLMIGTTIAGLFFGTFFGFELPFQVMSLSDQLLEVMIISISIGIIHLLLGLFLNTVINNRKKDYAESFVSGYSWILVLLSAVGLAANAFFGGPNIINIVAIAIIILSLVASIFINIFANENKVEGIVQGVFGIFDVTGYIGDVISYTRLTALGVASANIAMAFNLIIGLLPPVAKFTVGILIFVGLHLFNMFIGMISGYVHTLRLNYVEFFGKFYEGGGHEFIPIPMLQKHILIKEKKTQ